MEYPLKLRFKLWALAPQFSVFDANENLLYYVKQKLFKLKEDIGVFSDRQRINQNYSIKADRIIDFSAKYRFTDMQERPFGSVKRKGLKSLWRARYNIFDRENEVAMIREESVFTRFMDHWLSGIPLIGFLTGYLFHPTYLVTRTDGTEIMRLRKMPAFFEGKFRITKLCDLDELEETRTLLSLLMMILLERRRG